MNYDELVDKVFAAPNPPEFFRIAWGVLGLGLTCEGPMPASFERKLRDMITVGEGEKVRAIE